MNTLRKVATRLYDGSIVVGWRLARWPWSTPEGGTKLGRCIVILLGGMASWRIPWLFCLLWCLLAWRAGPRDFEPEQDGDDELPEPPAPPRKGTPDEVRAWILPKIRALIADRNGVHLDQLLTRLMDDGEVSPAARVTGFRKYLESNGIPVRDSLNIGNVTRVGIHRDDLITVAGGGAGPDLLAPPPPDPFEPQ